MALYADLHRHLGGALHPRIIYKFLKRQDHPVLNYFPDYDGFYNWFTRPCRTLEEFVKIHSLVEELQSLEHLPYFCLRLCRGAYTFENLQYLELRYNPYFRTDHKMTEAKRLGQMNEIVEVIRLMSGRLNIRLRLSKFFVSIDAFPKTSMMPFSNVRRIILVRWSALIWPDRKSIPKERTIGSS